MGVHLRRAGALLLAASMGLGCSLAGLDSGYGVDASGDAGASSDAPPGDGTSDGTTGGDSCNRPENCTNGVDDNCNGLVDCADPECMEAGYACTAGAVPSGWTLVAYSATTRPVCPASFGSEHAVVSNLMAQAASCSCSCSGSNATCGGNTNFQEYPNACSTNVTNVNLAVNNGACSPTSFGTVSGDSYQLHNSVPQASQGTCSGTGTVTGKPAPTFSAGATCDVATPLGAGCSTPSACAPPPSSAFKLCVAHAGSVACPQFGFTQQTLASTGTPGYVDTRGCGSCTCGTSLSCNAVGSIGLWTNGTCGGGAAYVVTAGCGLYNSSVGIASYSVSFSTTGSATCQPTGASTGTGSVGLDSQVETICCPP